MKAIERHIHQLLRGGPISDTAAPPAGGDSSSAELDEEEERRGGKEVEEEEGVVEEVVVVEAEGLTEIVDECDDFENGSHDEAKEVDDTGHGPGQHHREGLLRDGHETAGSRNGHLSQRTAPGSCGRCANGSGERALRPRSSSNGPIDSNDSYDKQARLMQTKHSKQNKRKKTRSISTTHRRLPPPEAAQLVAMETNVVAAGGGSSETNGKSQQWVAKGQNKPKKSNVSENVSPLEAQPPRNKMARVTLQPERCVKINREMISIFNELQPSDQEMQAKLNLMERLQKIVGDLWPGYQPKLKLFGSSANGFCLKRSDLDICMTIDRRAGTKKKIVNRIARVLRENKMKRVTALSHASVPIVKFEDPISHFSCDICINNILALHNTHMIAQYSRVDSRLLQLGFCIKYWAKRRKLDKPYTGTLSSYAWVLLVINFLQQRNPPVLPCLQRATPSGDLHGDVPTVMVKGRNCYFYNEDIGRLKFNSTNQETLSGLLLDFFYLYAEEFDYEQQVVCVRRGGLITKKEKRWDKLPKTVKENHWFSIEDPFDLSHDLGRVVDQDNLKAIQHELRRAYFLLTTTGSFAAVCEEYTSEA